ncbi:MAG: hypothetical protein BM556_16165, partial [Bacteriovorax sp. MedPE-SWde]
MIKNQFAPFTMINFQRKFVSGFVYLLLVLFLAGCNSKSTPVAVNPPAPLEGSTTITGTTPIVADGVDSSTITITMVDNNGVALVGATPTFSATNTDSKNVYGACSSSNSSGLSTCTLKSTRAETKSLQLVSPGSATGVDLVFNPGPVTKLHFSTAPSSSVLVGANLATMPVVQTTDQFENIVPATVSTITLAAFTDSSCTTPATGTLNVTSNPLTTDGSTGTVSFAGVNYSKWDDIYLQASAAGLTSACSGLIEVRQVISTGLSSVVGTTPATADYLDSSDVTITLLDTLSNPVYGAVPVITATDTNGTNLYQTCPATNASGISICSFQSTKAEVKTVTLMSPIVKVGNTITFVPGPAVAAKSTINGTTPVIADGVATSNVTITINDFYLNGISGVTPVFNATDTGTTNTYGACSLTDAIGVSSCTLTATKAETKTIQLTSPFAVTGNDAIFTNGPIANLTYSVQPSISTYENVDLAVSPTLVATDAFANLITNTALPVTLSAHTDVGCTISAPGTLSATENPKSTSTTDGSVAFTNVTYSQAGTIYIKASNAGVSTCSNAITVLARPVLSYSTSTLNENVNNIGTVTETIVITISDETFTGANGENYIGAGKIVATNIPTGFTAIANKDSATQITVSLTGSATSHLNADDISNLGLAFQDTAFTAAPSSVVQDATKTDITVNFLDPHALTYSLATLTEDLSNTGLISESLVVTLTGTTFTGTNGEDSDALSKVSFTNTPPGITANAVKTDDTTITITFTGTATNHTNTEDIANFTVNFADSAFTSGVAAGVLDSSNNDIIIDFTDPATLSYDLTTITENLSNVGLAGNSLVITLTEDTFVSDLTGLVNVSNIPAGYTESIVRDSDTQVTFSLTGNASSHDNVDDIANLEVSFTAGAFTNNTNAANVINSNLTNLVVDFYDSASLAYSKTTLTEAFANDGSFTGDSIVITLTNDTFEADLTGQVSATNLPAGISAVFTRDSAVQVTLTLTGNALAHANINDQANLEVHFLAGAFTNNTNAASVTDNDKSDFVIDFKDPAAISYDVTTINEDTVNDGSIVETMTVTLTDDLFTNPLLGVSATNVPAGLTANFTRLSDTSVQINFSGNATLHSSTDNIANLGITFTDASFQNSSAASITDSARSDLSIAYTDPASLAYATSIFTEDTDNTGQTTDSIIITLTGDTFEADLTGDINVTNTPVGMTPVVTRDSATQVTLTLTGNATSHINTDDIGNLTITFTDNAFVSNSSAANIVDYIKSDIAVDFNDPASLAYDVSILNEAIVNVGSITEVAVITLTGDTFDTDLTGDITATNVPTGLTAVFTRDSATQVTMSLTGNATNHAVANDITNLTVTFADTAFVSNSTASNVINYTKSDITLSYIDPASLAYSASTYTEDAANDGSISNSIIITLTDDTFAASIAGLITPTNLPATLAASFVRDSATQITAILTGNASAHANLNDVSNLTFTFADAIFVNNSTAA